MRLDGIIVADRRFVDWQLLRKQISTSTVRWLSNKKLQVGMDDNPKAGWVKSASRNHEHHCQKSSGLRLFREALIL